MKNYTECLIVADSIIDQVQPSRASEDKIVANDNEKVKPKQKLQPSLVNHALLPAESQQ